MNEKEWHISKYNLTAKIPESGRWVIVNLMTGACVPMNAATLYAMSNLSELPKDTELLQKLAKLGVITDYDELAELEAMGRMACTFCHSVELTICPTMGCNFDCPYCFEDHRLEKMTEKTQNDLLRLTEKLLDISKAKNLRITWFGGEPLLALDIIGSLSDRLMGICDKKDIQYSAGIVTNGYLLDQDVVDMLSRVRVTTAQITLDGIGEVHDRTRHLANGDPSFDRIADNLRTLKIPFEVSVRHNVHLENIDQIEPVRRFVKELSEVSDNNIRYYPSPVSDNKRSRNRGSDLTIICGNDESLVGIRRDSDRLSRATGYYCGAQTLWSIGIDALGNLHKCWETVDKPEESFASAADWDPMNPFETAADPDKLTSFLNTSGVPDDECRDCIWLPACRGGCPYARLHTQKNCLPYKNNPEEFVKMVYADRQCRK